MNDMTILCYVQNLFMISCLLVVVVAFLRLVVKVLELDPHPSHLYLIVVQLLLHILNALLVFYKDLLVVATY